ncbi:hypothetical protein [Mycobacterium tuberculosis]|uniref:hypothetical protein n=1 Tax=Mycobacterium tuberculosis TaxID=1773 RepID=UPI00350F6BC8
MRHLLRALGVSGRIKSPTYAVVEPHSSARPTPSTVAVASRSGTTTSSPVRTRRPCPGRA